MYELKLVPFKAKTFQQHLKLKPNLILAVNACAEAHTYRVVFIHRFRIRSPDISGGVSERGRI
jgi:hypothetical protein